MHVRLFFIFLFLFTSRSHNSKAQCDTILSGFTTKKIGQEIKLPIFFRYSGYIISDTCNTDNRVIKTAINNQIEYYKMKLLSFNNIESIEKKFSGKEKNIKSNFNFEGNIHEKMFSYYRQYNACFVTNDTIIINILFLPRSYVKEHIENVRHSFLSPLVINENKHLIYSCYVKASADFNFIRIISFNRISSRPKRNKLSNRSS